MNRKALAEAFVVLMFIVVLLIVLFLWLGISANMTVLKTQASEAKTKNVFAREAYNALVSCNEQQVIDESNLALCIANNNIAEAIMIRQPELRGCENKIWGEATYIAATYDPGVDSYVYWIPIRQTDTGQVCIAEMLIAI